MYPNKTKVERKLIQIIGKTNNERDFLFVNAFYREPIRNTLWFSEGDKIFDDKVLLKRSDLEGLRAVKYVVDFESTFKLYRNLYFDLIKKNTSFADTTDIRSHWRFHIK